FDARGNSLYSFFAYATTFRGGVNVAAGDVNGDGVDEIITGAGAGGAPHVRVFDARGNSLYSFFAYATTFRGGVNVAAGDVLGNYAEEIITGTGPGSAPHVRIFDQSGVSLAGFFAYATTFRGGVNVAAGDMDSDGINEIVTAPAGSGGPHVRVFSGTGIAESQLFAFPTSYRGSVSVAAQ
ncbi:MAG: FG-GAP repeat protein, partial [Candidatus Kerfeldbacteria bacterium]|nr:FG-GAP repeat protein [Candidatus Kerfeldbacteria bacterium]